MFLPWIGLFEQIRLADVFMHYDDVQLPQGRSFINRVQIKTQSGQFWLTAPLDRKRSGRLINEVLLARDEDWRARHVETIRHAYSQCPHVDDMMALVTAVYDNPTDSLAEFNIAAIQTLSSWFGLSPTFLKSSDSGVDGKSTRRLIDLCRLVDADVYVTGLGALLYLDHELFESRGIAVRYMDYEKRPYPQRHGDFIPFVSILDAIANCGEQAKALICSESVDWRDVRVE